MAYSIEEALLSTVLFVLMGGLLTAAFSVVAVVPIVLASPFLGARRLVQMIRRVVLFIGLLHGLSLVANAVFVAAFRGRLYYSADPVIDWLPYLPFSGFATDPACGGHLADDFSETTFVLAWSAFAIPVWVGTVLLFRHLTPNPPYPARFTKAQMVSG